MQQCVAVEITRAAFTTRENSSAICFILELDNPLMDLAQ
jgi:hypothetical protein